MLTDNIKLGETIDETKSRSVLSLGRFGEGLKERLELIKERLRKTKTPSSKPYNPIVFDFDKGAAFDLIEEIVLLAMLSRFIIADLSDPKFQPKSRQFYLY